MHYSYGNSPSFFTIPLKLGRGGDLQISARYTHGGCWKILSLAQSFRLVRVHFELVNQGVKTSLLPYRCVTNSYYNCCEGWPLTPFRNMAFQRCDGKILDFNVALDAGLPLRNYGFLAFSLITTFLKSEHGTVP